MPVIRDVEDLMNEVRDIMVANLETEFNAINAEKGDSKLIDFNSDAYFLYKLQSVESVSTFEVSFYQFITEQTLILNNQQNAINVGIGINVIVPDKSECKTNITALRYQRAVMQVFEKHIAPIKSSISDLSSIAIIESEDGTGGLYTIAQTIFDIAIC